MRDAASARGVCHADEVLNADGPATSDPALVAAIEDAPAEAGLPSTRMVSRAYHDCVLMATICPAAMIFVPSKGGVSHRPDEYTSALQIAQGARVLAGALRRLAG
ncbi:MAG TPA: M20/M25/M40 family metallo-hydrolase [Miltoncostaeaceae bacterium]|nr:M20/M25/M40 family metallo-hydrolase [Miltoncostaeaceae bacterium]